MNVHFGFGNKICYRCENYWIAGEISGDISVYSKSKPAGTVLRGHSSRILHLKCIENTLFSSSNDRTLIIWDLNENSIRNQLFFNSQIVNFAVNSSTLTVLSEDQWATYELS